jgi:hypothetical protein
MKAGTAKEGYVEQPSPARMRAMMGELPSGVMSASTSAGIACSSDVIKTTTIAPPPPIVGGYRFGPHFIHGQHYTITTHYKPRWLTRFLMANLLELHWVPVDKPLVVPTKEQHRHRGFASMDPQRQREIASGSARAPHEKGNAS